MTDSAATLLIWWALAATAVAAITMFILSDRNSTNRALQQQLDSSNAARRTLLEEVQAAKQTIYLEAQKHKAEIERADFKLLGQEMILNEKVIAFPWLASAIADLHALQAERDAEYLRRKKHPAIRAAEQVAAHSKHRRLVEREARILKYRIEYYEKMFPWLVELTGEDVDTLLEQVRLPEKRGGLEGKEEDAARFYLSDVEYQSLSASEKYQRALNRYLASRKSKWEVGRDFERYIGFQYERQGYRVEYRGIIDGLYDLGRDLIVSKNGSIRVVQCKRWSANKTIHEKHIFQLYGTVIELMIQNNVKPKSKQGSLFIGMESLVDIKGVFVTTTTLSPLAMEFANVLGIEVKKELIPEPYPMIKCNISRDGQKIYHLPFDQQYDRVRVELERGEFYASTIEEAEKRGFRRAWRWRPEASN